MFQVTLGDIHRFDDVYLDIRYTQRVIRLALRNDENEFTRQLGGFGSLKETETFVTNLWP